MKKCFLVGCIFAIISSSFGTAVDPKSNDNEVRKNVEKCFADGTGYFLAAQKIKAALDEMKIVQSNPNYRLSVRSKKILTKYNLLDSSGAPVKDACEIYEEMREKVLDEDFMRAIIARQNIDEGMDELP